MKIKEQVELLMQGADFGDETIAETMAKELEERLIESERPLSLYASIAVTIRLRLIFTWVIPSQCASCASSRSWDIT